MNTKLILSLSLFAVLLMGAISFDDAYAKDDKKEKQTKLQKECAKDPKSDDKIKAHCELLGLINDADAGTSDPRTDSFFDVFFDIELYTVDSFFDVIVQLQNDITELQTQSHDKYTDAEAIDAVGLHTVDTDTLYSGVDFATSNQNCTVGEIVTGIDENGIITCTPDQTGTSTDTSALQNQVNALQNQVDILRCASMIGPEADLHGCDFSRVDLSGVDLSGANLRNANLRYADLTDTNLNVADLTGADLTNARLSGNLNGAKFINANLSGANLSGATLFEHFTFVKGAYADPPCTGHSVCSTIPTSP